MSLVRALLKRKRNEPLLAHSIQAVSKLIDLRCFPVRFPTAGDVIWAAVDIEHSPRTCRQQQYWLRIKALDTLGCGFLCIDTTKCAIRCFWPKCVTNPAFKELYSSPEKEVSVEEVEKLCNERLPFFPSLLSRTLQSQKDVLATLSIYLPADCARIVLLLKTDVDCF